MSEARDDRGDQSAAADGGEGRRGVRLVDLLRGDREVVIEHAGARYRLRLTRRNRLVLQR